MKQPIEFFLACIVLLFFSLTGFAQKLMLTSPDNKLKVDVLLSPAKKLSYSINYQGQEILRTSRLGIVREDEDFSANMKWLSISAKEKATDSYTLLTGKKKNIVYIANRQTVYLQSSTGKKMNIIFQVSNDAVAFRYYFPQKSETIHKIKEERTSFHFNATALSWLQPKAEAQSGWEHCNPAYEENYVMGAPAGTSSSSSNGFVYPSLFQTGNNWVLITEAGLESNYCGTALQQHAPDAEYSIGFPQPAEGMKGQPINPESTLPWFTPWRVITVGSLATIIESTAGTDLAEPAKKMNMDFIKPGKAAWSWALGHDNATNFSTQKKFIDYAADMHWQYSLIDADWDTRIGYDSIKILSDYAAQKNVGLILWYNSAGDWNTTPYHPRNRLLTSKDRLKEFSSLKAMGIKGVKIDFFAGDGQSMIAYYHDILKDAASVGLLVNFHGATLPRGWTRTYPNMVSAEAVKGFEMITFGQKAADEAAAHCCMLPFTRNAFDPMDFTPMCLYKIHGIERKTTAGFELALSVLFISGIQHYAEWPEGMTTVPAYVKTFLQNVPLVWEEVKFLDGFPGKHVIVARKAGNKWYVAGINGELNAKQMKLDLSFAGKNASITYIGDDASGKVFTQEKIRINAKGMAELQLHPNGGFVMEISSGK